MVVVKEGNELELIDRQNGKSKFLCQLSETPIKINLYGDWMILLFINQNFRL